MGWTARDIPDQSGRTAVVTGANSGIGFHTAQELARKGAHVVLACRSEPRGRDALNRIVAEAPSASVELAPLDLGNLASVRRFAEDLAARSKRLDLLVNNAGVMVPPLGRTEDGFELQFGINHLGHFAFTGLLLQLIADTPGARVVTVSSLMHRPASVDFDNLNAEQGYRPQRAYGQSKLANLLFAFELERRLRAQGAAALSIASHPGWTATNLQRHAPLTSFFNRFFAQGAARGALPSLYAATAPEAEGGGYYGPGGLLELRGLPKPATASRAARDRDTAARLWRVSEDMTGVRFLSEDAETG